MINVTYAVIAVVLTMFISSIIPFDNPLGIALKVGQFQMIGGLLGVILVFALKERQKNSSDTKMASL